VGSDNPDEREGDRECDLTADGSSRLVFRDQAGKPRAELGLKADGSPHLGFLDSAGQVLFTAP
jgi:hypothetical protein